MRKRVRLRGAAAPALLLMLPLLSVPAVPRRASAADVGRLSSLLNRFVSNPNDGNALNEIEGICLSAGRPGAEQERAAVSAAILSKLGPRTPAEARVRLLGQLERIGGAEVVAGLSQLLADQDATVRECARRALESNPSPRAGKALQKALEKAKDAAWRAALVNSLGERREEAAAGDLANILTAYERDKKDRVASGSSKEPTRRGEEVAIAAAAALGKIGGTDAAKALSSAMAKGSPAYRAAAVDGYLSCADRFVAEGYYSEATAIYKKLYSAKGSKLLRIAAMQGLAAVQAAKASGKKERKPKPSSSRDRSASAASSEASKPAVAPDVLAAWGKKLLARTEKSVNEGSRPRFLLASMRTKARVVGVAAGGQLKIEASGMQLGVPMSRLKTKDRKNLAVALVQQGGGDPEGHAIAAFYCLALGETTEAGVHLGKAGKLAGEVRKLFE